MTLYAFELNKGPLGFFQGLSINTLAIIVTMWNGKNKKNYTVFLGLVLFLDKPAEILLWVDKYKPASIRSIVGQHGEKSNAKKLLKWLINWDDNHSGESKPKGGTLWKAASVGLFSVAFIRALMSA